MKNANIKILCFIIILLIIATVPIRSFAMASLSEMVTSAGEFLSRGSQEDKIKQEDLKAFVLPVGQILVSLAVAILVIVTVIMGIKYMTSGPEEQGKLKKQLIGLVVSAVVIFASHTIWSIMYNTFKDF